MIQCYFVDSVNSECTGYIHSFIDSVMELNQCPWD